MELLTECGKDSNDLYSDFHGQRMRSIIVSATVEESVLMKLHLKRINQGLSSVKERIVFQSETFILIESGSLSIIGPNVSKSRRIAYKINNGCPSYGQCFETWANTVAFYFRCNLLMSVYFGQFLK